MDRTVHSKVQHPGVAEIKTETRYDIAMDGMRKIHPVINNIEGRMHTAADVQTNQRFIGNEDVMVCRSSRLLLHPVL